MVPANSDRISPVPPYSGYSPQYSPYMYGTITLFGSVFQTPSIWVNTNYASPTTPHNISREVWANPRSLATTCGIINYFLLLRVLRCFSSPGYRLSTIPLHGTGLPHSDICGSQVVCTSPQLFAAYHVLHRLWEPRHPPYALICFLLFAVRSKMTPVTSLPTTSLVE